MIPLRKTLAEIVENGLMTCAVFSFKSILLKIYYFFIFEAVLHFGEIKTPKFDKKVNEQKFKFNLNENYENISDYQF